MNKLDINTITKPYLDHRWIKELNFIKIHAAVYEKSQKCFTNFVPLNQKNRSQRPNLNK